jgi:hypothetical protein
MDFDEVTMPRAVLLAFGSRVQRRVPLQGPQRDAPAAAMPLERSRKPSLARDSR